MAFPVRLAAMLLVLVFGSPVSVGAVMHEPFPAGALTGHMGTILYDGGSSSRTPFISAVYLKPGLNSAGIALTAVRYYDAMDNYSDRLLTTLGGGGWFSGRRWLCKAAVTQFDALGIYYEQSGYLSGAVVLFHDIRLGIEATGTRLMLADDHFDALHLARGGVRCLVPVRPVLLTAAVKDITLWSGDAEGADPSLRIECGIHSVRHAFGAQGIVFSIVPAYQEPLSMTLGQEIVLHENVALHAALHSNPFLFSFGVQIWFGRGGATAAMVNHPVLGWSRGFSLEYAHRRN